MIANYKTYPIIFIVMTIVSGCYFPVSGTIIDAETKKPIEGAVVLVEWMKTKGIGFTYTESYKVADTLSDKEGRFTLPGCLCLGTEDPDIIIYKVGYIAWNNKYVFPCNSKRNDFLWGSTPILLNKYDKSLLHADHMDFIRSSIHSTINYKAKQVIFKAMDDE